MIKVLAVIPARLKSTRLPDKVLRDIAGKSLVQRVYEQVIQAKLVDKVIIAVDDSKVADHVTSFNGKWIMTDPGLPSGTDRCSYVASVDSEFTHVINIQGDEPFINPIVIDQLIELITTADVDVASMMNRVIDPFDYSNPNIVKLVVNKNLEALYFSRASIPFQRDLQSSDWKVIDSSYRHLGIYAFRSNVLQVISKLPVGNLERIEMLEQLRWLEAGYKIKMALTDYKSFGIDTEEDLQRAIQFAQNQK